MNKIIAIIAAVALSITPVYALTFEQAQNEFGGMSCGGSVCSSHEDGTRTFENPDIVTKSQQLDPNYSTENTPASASANGCPLIKTMNGGFTKPINVNADCVSNSIGTTNRAVLRTVVTTTDGGTTIVDTCTTNTINIDFNPIDGFILDKDKSTSDGSC